MFDINKGITEYKNDPGSVLLDVREMDEFAAGHIPEAINHPLSKIIMITAAFPDTDKMYYVYCRSGNRSGKAVEMMKDMGYKYLKNIGGIMDYTGTIEK